MDITAHVSRVSIHGSSSSHPDCGLSTPGGAAFRCSRQLEPSGGSSQTRLGPQKFGGHTSIYSNPKLVALYISAPTRVAVEGQQRGVVFLSKITPSTGR